MKVSHFVKGDVVKGVKGERRKSGKRGRRDYFLINAHCSGFLVFLDAFAQTAHRIPVI
jgi:hypothetical protein